MVRLDALDADAVEKMLVKPASWHATRGKGIGGSDAGVIWSGDWLDLFNEKLGRTLPKNLLDQLPPMMGTWTEALNIWWFERRTGLKVQRQKKSSVHPKHSFMRANFDGFVEDGAIIECKHVHAFTKDETVVSNYYAQCQHLMEVAGADVCYLSVFFGSAKYEWFDIGRDQPFIDELIEKERRFWVDHVLKGVEPAKVETEAAVAISFDDMREADLSDSNVWGNFAGTWLDLRESVVRLDEAVSELKKLVDPDVKRAFGAGIEIKRAKNGALTIKELKE